MQVSDNKVFICGYTAAFLSPVRSVRNIISQHYVLHQCSAETQHKMAKPCDMFKVVQWWKRLTLCKLLPDSASIADTDGQKRTEAFLVFFSI